MVANWPGVLALAALAVGLTDGGDLGYLARSVAVVCLVPYFLLGVAGVHGWAARQRHGGLLLAVMYGVLVLGLEWVVLPVTGFGLMRHVMRYRSSGPGADGGKEE